VASGNPDYGFEIPSGGLDLVGAAADDTFLRASVLGDTHSRYFVDYKGAQSWGPGNAVKDASLERASAGHMTLHGTLEVTDTLEADASIFVKTLAVGDVGLTVTLLAGQTGDAMRVKDSAGAVLFGVDKSGNVAAAGLSLTTPLPVASGGSGTATPSLVAGANITITGTWPNNTIALKSPITGVFTVGDGTGNQEIRISGGAGYTRRFSFLSGGAMRWLLYAAADAEGGGNTGSSFAIARYADTGAILSYPLLIRRSDGQVGINNLTPGKQLDVTGDVRASLQLISTVATGTAPLAVTSTTEVANLRAATATDLAAGSILTVAKGGTGRGAGALPIYANNAAAVAGGLAVGDFYRTGADPDPVCVVH
jgi:hypothetical protein